MLSIPGLQVFSPADANEMKTLIEASMSDLRPFYIRFGKGGEEIVTSDFENFDFMPKVFGSKDSDIVICTTGVMLQNCLGAKKLLEKIGKSANLNGFVNVSLLVDPNTGLHKFFEFDSRPTIWHHIFFDFNVPFKSIWNKSIKFHKKHGGLVTVTAVRPTARFGRLKLENDLVVSFGEKLQSEEGWINGGFFVLDREVIDYISGDDTPFEGNPLRNLTEKKELFAYKHFGFWSPVDTLREKHELEVLWNNGAAPWTVFA
jgi:hypothetical protein